MFDFSAIAGPDPTSRSEPGAIGQIAVTAPRKTALLSELEARMAKGQGFSLATLNLDHVVKIVRDPVFRAAYAAQTHVTADGNPIVWLCRIAGQDVELIPGSELVEPVAALAVGQKVCLAMVGSTEASLAGATRALETRYPGLEVSARIAPPMGFDPQGPGADEVIEQLRASGAGVCFLALGAPKQEVFAARAQTALPQMGFLSIGAGLDFLSGAQVRAPALARMLALEWFWRLLSNPGRLFLRYMACFAILPRAVRMARKARRGSAAVAPIDPSRHNG
jgi:N-acetylglucosaminyldiphosphoundecaprenol N-acetyl-beta-D-mannosaminyltransferase